MGIWVVGRWARYVSCGAVGDFKGLYKGKQFDKYSGEKFFSFSRGGPIIFFYVGLKKKFQKKFLKKCILLLKFMSPFFIFIIRSVYKYERNYLQMDL